MTKKEDKSRIVLVLSHKPDNRYGKRLDLLKEDYTMGVVYWNKEEKPLHLSLQDVEVQEVHLPADRTNPLKRIPQTLQFLQQAYQRVEQLRPACIYVGNLDMLWIAARYKKKHKNTLLIYEIADLHRLVIDQQKHPLKKLISLGLKGMEKALIGKVDRLVLTSMKFYDCYYQHLIDKRKVLFMPNMPKEGIFNQFRKQKHQQFTVGFIGWIRYKEQLKLLIHAAEKAGVHLLFAGEDAEGEEFERYCAGFPHVTFLGPFDYERDILDIYSQVDCIYAVYDADMRNVRVALPNKLYEAILCELPILVAKQTYLEELVKSMGIGEAVHHKSQKELTAVLKKLSQDRAYYEGLCTNCRLHRGEAEPEAYNQRLLLAIARHFRNNEYRE